MPTTIGDYSYRPWEGEDLGGLKEGSFIEVRRLNGDISAYDLPVIREELERRFPPRDYVLKLAWGVSSAGVSAIKVYVGYSREARLRRTESAGSPLHVTLSDMVARLNP